jgi:hypothetical protein
MDKKRDSFSLVQALEQSISKLVEKFLPKNNFTVFAQGELTKLWAEIEQMEPKMSIIEADKVVDVILKRAGVAGSTMAERLRKVQKLVPRPVYSGMWEAHKIRNELVHEVGNRTNPTVAQENLWKMKKFLISLGAFKNE